MKKRYRNKGASPKVARPEARTIGAALAALLIMAGLAGIGAAQAEDGVKATTPKNDVASSVMGRAVLTRKTSTNTRFPAILDAIDIQRYRKIFAAQKRGHWTAAKRLIQQLDDRVLMGHVLAQRFLHPTKYRSRFGELARWMKHYADHPDAKRIYRLAMRRKPRRAAAPSPPRMLNSGIFRKSSLKKKKRRRKSAGLRRGRAERSTRRYIQRLVRRERLSAAERYLNNPKTRRALGPAGIDRTRAIIAGGWFRWGNMSRALALAARAAKRSGRYASDAHWWAGLTAFKLKRYDRAAQYFAAAAEAPGNNSQETTRAAFWAARANLVGQKPARFNAWLTRAARHPRTFYGLLANHILGGAPRFNWNEPALADERTKALLATPSGKRALALIQVGQGRRAQRELRPLRDSTEPRHLRAIIALADAAGLPATAYRAARMLRALIGQRIDAALYPIPAWAPDGGYFMDRALVFALARQESAFNARAKSRSGARGLLQLMPATARYMERSRRAFRGRNRSRLFDPEVNLALGQKYMDYLLSGDVVAGNMIMMIAAYNGGPGNTAKWQRNMPHGADPLVFMETIPTRETRLFVKRVLENLWIYRMRLGQDAPTLTALAGGRWPYYIGLDTRATGAKQP